MHDAHDESYDLEIEPRRWRRLAVRGVIALLAVLLLYYPAGMIYKHRIDDDPDLKIDAEAGASRTVATAIALIRREIDDNGWVANDPFFYPWWPLDNMPNFQQGMTHAFSRFALEMTDQIGRLRGSSEVDRDLEDAAGLLRYPGDRWHFDFSSTLAPTPTSESQYRKAASQLESYNNRLAGGGAVFDRRADNLLGTLDRFSADLGSVSANLNDAISNQSFISPNSDDVFYRTKGKLYGYYMLLVALETDFQGVLEEKQVGPLWQELLDTLRKAIELDPLVVLNGAPDAAILPSHLAAQGFYLLRARTQLKEVSNVLLK